MEQSAQVEWIKLPVEKRESLIKSYNMYLISVIASKGARKY